MIMSLHEIDLAEKISDKILCVKGDHIEHFGTPEEIFSTGLIGTLYDISPKAFNPLLGSVEMPAPSGEPRAFVISACGSGIPVFRALQKAGTPFAAGILYENDVDYQVAASLAAEVVTEKPFEEISDGAMQRARELIDACEEVILCPVPIGSVNARLRELIDYAHSAKPCREV